MSPETQRSFARNLVSGLAVAYRGAKSTGKTYGLYESDAVGLGSGWVGSVESCPNEPGFTLGAVVRPVDTTEHVIAVMRRVASDSGITDLEAVSILDSLAYQLAYPPVETKATAEPLPAIPDETRKPIRVAAVSNYVQPSLFGDDI